MLHPGLSAVATKPSGQSVQPLPASLVSVLAAQFLLHLPPAVPYLPAGHVSQPVLSAFGRCPFPHAEQSVGSPQPGWLLSLHGGVTQFGPP